MGNLVPSRGDQRDVGGSTINNQTAPLPSVPDKHGISFVLSDLPISFAVERKPESRRLPRRKKQELRRREVNDGVTREERQHRDLCYSPPQLNTSLHWCRT